MMGLEVEEIMSLFIGTAHAAGAPAQPGGGMEMIIMLLVFGLVFCGVRPLQSFLGRVAWCEKKLW